MILFSLLIHFYGMSYAENSRETFRKQALHRFRTAALIEDNGKATNSPNYRYRLTEETVKILRTMETPAWKESIKRFLCYHEKLIDLYASKKKMTMMPVNINGEALNFQQVSIMSYKKPLSRNLHQDLHQIRSACTLVIQ